MIHLHKLKTTIPTKSKPMKLARNWQMLLPIPEPQHLILRQQNTIEEGMLSFFYWCWGELQII